MNWSQNNKITRALSFVTLANKSKIKIKWTLHWYRYTRVVGFAIFIAADSRTRLGTGSFFAIVRNMRPGKSNLLFLVLFKIILSSGSADDILV